ncbi:SCO family protein [Ectobacillus antri]|jgi:protein SCO1/2|uniref:SCO family protein n=1 Tax=Ectobacillus antri TaxID=2486280 RepID=A0ABT6H543_9BACI|nr:SCO family protein [Ectobacillus antri]MDG4656719.1 SCO family protein [Ectobacillus antri]MDG5753918.1 SCO family protein [Ectobacillus antri]
MKKLYITFVLMLIIAVGCGIFYFSAYRKLTMELPKGIVMENITGENISFDALPKKLKLVEFIYTNCPDICPVTTYKMKYLRNQLVKDGSFGKNIEFITITIDPARDTKERLYEYAETFDIKEGWHVLRGDEDQTKMLAKSFNFLYRDPGGGMYIHTSNTYLLDENNRLIEVFGMGEKGFNQDKVLKAIQEAL